MNRLSGIAAHIRSWWLVCLALVLLTSTSCGTRIPAAGQPSVTAGHFQLEYVPKLGHLGLATRFAIATDGSLWVPIIQASGENSLVHYVPATDQLARFPLPAARGGGYFVGIAVTRTSEVWVAWEHILVHVNGQSGSASAFEVPQSTAFAARTPAGSWVRDLAVGVDGHLWLSRENATSLLEFDPATASFSELPTPEFGVPDRITVAADGTLWLTQAHDPVARQEHTAVLSVSTSHKVTLHSEKASSIAADPLGPVVLAGDSSGLEFVNAAGQVTQRQPAPFVPTAADIAISQGGLVAVANRHDSAVALLQPGSSEWSTFALNQRTTTVRPPYGYTGPPTMLLTAEVTDMHAAPADTIWILIATTQEFAKIHR